MVEGVAHTLLKERRLQATTAHLWNGGGTGKQGYSVVDTEGGGSAGLAVKVGQEAHTVPAYRRNGAGL